jgi:hypothetical protein
LTVEDVADNPGSIFDLDGATVPETTPLGG